MGFISSDARHGGTLEQHQQPLAIAWSGVALVFLASAMGGFLYGYDIGATSFAMMLLLGPQEVRDGGAWWQEASRLQFRSSAWQQGLTVAAVSLGGMMGSHWAGCLPCVERLGRRMELRLAAICMATGACLNVASGTVLQTAGPVGFAALIAGRWVFGIGVGFVMHGAPTYLAEMIPSSIRGAVISAKETVIVFGILMGYWAGDACSRGMMQNGSNGDDSTSIDWSRLYAMSAILSLPMFGLTFFIPRSLRWLLMHGHPAEALQSMKFVYADRDSAIQLEFDRLQKSMHSIPVHDDAQFDTKQVECGGLLQKLMSPSLWPSFRAAMGLIVLQQCSGQPSVLSFSTLIFRAAGWNGRASVATALVMLCVSVSTIFTVDRWGRKRFLYICCSVLALAASILAWQFWDWKAIDEGHTLSESCKMIVLVAMFAFIGGYQIGFGPITWLIVSEVFPGDVRGAATALGVEWNYLLNFGVQFLVPIAKDTIGWGPTFGMYASILVFAISFIHLYVPETAGMTLEAIEDQLIQRGENDKEGGIALFMETIPTADEQYPLVASPAYKSNSLHSLQYDIDAAHPSYI